VKVHWNPLESRGECKVHIYAYDTDVYLDELHWQSALQKSLIRAGLFKKFCTRLLMKGMRYNRPNLEYTYITILRPIILNRKLESVDYQGCSEDQMCQGLGKSNTC